MGNTRGWHDGVYPIPTKVSLRNDPLSYLGVEWFSKVFLLGNFYERTPSVTVFCIETLRFFLEGHTKDTRLFPALSCTLLIR